MKQLILLRGLPGAGKTTLANFFKVNIIQCAVIAADDYLTDSTGKYTFDVSLLGKAHEYCRSTAEQSMSSSTEVVIVHNTNTTNREMKPYLELAEKYGYEVMSLIVENRHGSSSVHNVPEETLNKMKERFDVKLM